MEPMTEERLRALAKLYDRNPQVMELVEYVTELIGLSEHRHRLNNEHYFVALAAREMLTDEQRDGLDERVGKGEFRE